MSTNPKVSPRTGWLSLDDNALLAQCEEDHYRASGPGGQKRNKTESAVRLRHPPSGVIVVAVESRSQHENRARALKRIREAIALQCRQSSQLDDSTPLLQAVKQGRLQLSTKSPEFLPFSALVLDHLLDHSGRVSEVSAALGISTGNLIRFLKSHRPLWQAAQQIRQQLGLSLLK